MNEENEQEATPISIVIPPKTTHWCVWMVHPGNRLEKLSHKETTRSARETRWELSELQEPDGSLSLGEDDSVFDERWGWGTYIIGWYGVDQEGKFTSLGKTPAFVIGEPSHEEEEPDENEFEDEDQDGSVEEEDREPSAPRAARGVPSVASAATPDIFGGLIGSTPPPRGGAPAAVAGAPQVPPIPVPIPATSASGMADPLPASLTLFSFHQAQAAAARAEARADQELSLRRFEIEQRASVERQRMMHEQEIERTRQFYKEMSRGSEQASPTETLRQLRDMLEEVEERIEERLEQRLAVAMGAGGAPGQDTSTAGAIIGAIKDASPMIMPMIQNAIGGGNTSGGSSS